MRQTHRPAGFTLVETLVAIVLLQLGVFALMATAGASARDLAEAAARRRALTAARNRAEALRVGACDASVSGSARRAGGLVESWRVEAKGASRVVIATASVPLPRGRRASVEARSLAICRS